jgi:uncharacterized protein (DUF1684 family)
MISLSKMKYACIFFFILFNQNLFAQNYNYEIKSWRENYKNDFLKEERSPLKADQLQYLRFYEPDSTYRVEADFSLTKNASVIDVPTMSGKTKQYIEYGKLKFKLQGKPLNLTIYQGIKLLENPETKDYLFVPFTDSTNGNDTYINGR